MPKRWSILILLLLSLAHNTQAQTEQVFFSAPGGFYDSCFHLTLECFYPEHTIRYTTNGSTPTATSPQYTTPLYLDQKLYSHSNLYTIPTCPSFLFHDPDSVRHAIVIKAAVFNDEGGLLSEVGCQTYLIHALGDVTHGPPVISITADSLDLFDFNTGIMVPGANFNPSDSLWTGNYYQSGEEWERRVHVEFYEPDGTQGIHQGAGLRTHGGTARRGLQKGLRLYARKEYGDKRFRYRFFKNLPIESYKHLVLKPFINQWFSHGIQDDICNHMAAKLQVESLASRPTVMFLNGEYWGIYYLKERPDSHYLEDHFGHDEEDYNVIEDWYGSLGDGDNTNFKEMMEWLKNNDLTQDAAYEELCSLIDMDCFIDYYCLELFIANNDWPSNNMRCYQWKNGPWRWIFFDGDDCLIKMDFDVFDNATSESGTGWPTNPTATLLFRKLLQRPDFQYRFVRRFEALLSDVFSYPNTKPMLDEAAEQVREGIPFQVERFGKPISVSGWEELIAQLDRFLQDRGTQIRERLIQFLQVEDHNISAMALAPNPAHDQLTVRLECEHFGISELYLYNLRGHLIDSYQIYLQKGSNDIHLDLRLRAGVYIIKVGQIAQKLIVK